MLGRQVPIEQEIESLASASKLFWDQAMTVTEARDYLGYLDTWLLFLVLRQACGQDSCSHLFESQTDGQIIRDNYRALENPGKLAGASSLPIHPDGTAAGTSPELVKTIKERFRNEDSFSHLISFTDPAANFGKCHFVAAHFSHDRAGMLHVAIDDPFYAYQDDEGRVEYQRNLQKTLRDTFKDQKMVLTLNEVQMQNEANCGIHAAFNMNKAFLDPSIPFDGEEFLAIREGLQKIRMSEKPAEALQNLQAIVAPVVARMRAGADEKEEVGSQRVMNEAEKIDRLYTLLDQLTPPEKHAVFIRHVDEDIPEIDDKLKAVEAYSRQLKNASAPKRDRVSEEKTVVVTRNKNPTRELTEEERLIALFENLEKLPRLLRLHIEDNFPDMSDRYKQVQNYLSLIDMVADNSPNRKLLDKMDPGLMVNIVLTAVDALKDDEQAKRGMEAFLKTPRLTENALIERCGEVLQNDRRFGYN